MELVAQRVHGVGHAAEEFDAGAFEEGVRSCFVRDGYVVVRKLFDARTVMEMGIVADALRDSPDSVHGAWKYYDDDARLERGVKLIHRVERFRDAAPVFGRVLRDRAMMRLAEVLLGGPAVLFKEKINYKPFGGSGFAAHQDMQAGWSKYASAFVSAFVAIDATNTENGCLELAANAHTRGLLGPEWRPLDDTTTSGLAFTPVPLERGDAIFFGALTPHRSAPNRTPFDRRVLCATYNAAASGDHYETYYADKFASLPPHVARRAGVEYRYRV